MGTYKASTEQARAKGRNYGQNWIAPSKRLAIYLRDGLACAYCGQSIATTAGVQLTLDHIQPYSLGGSNHETNLVTCCSHCNSSRGNRSYEDFAAATAHYLNHGITAAQIIAHIQDCLTRPLDIKAAKDLIAKQGSCFKVLQAA